MTSSARGRSFFFNPGPTNIPDRVLSAMQRPTLDFLSEEFLVIHRRVHEGIKRVLRTKQHLFVYCANGHGAWEAALANCFSPGEKVVVLESGHFSASWAQMARSLGLDLEILAADWRLGVPVDALEARLRSDPKGDIKAVLVVHNETATGVVHPLAEICRAIDAARHPALLLVDTISSLGSLEFRMDDWGVDVVVGGSQKGLMMATGVSFTGVSDKALARSKKSGMRRSFWDWGDMLTREPQKFPGTTPVHMFYGLDVSLKMIDEEGLDAVIARHSRFGAATRAAVAHWGANVRNRVSVSANGILGPVEAIELFCADPLRLSDSVTTILVPTGHDANALRKVAMDRFNLSLGAGLGPLGGRAFRIGHMGDLNEPMLLGALATVELAMKVAGVPHQSGGVDAAVRSLASGA
jgi:alanine-glyoxylate transaminase/serine-glyoxylate transaminase/serine-pyruvate transaminase